MDICTFIYYFDKGYESTTWPLTFDKIKKNYGDMSLYMASIEVIQMFAQHFQSHDPNNNLSPKSKPKPTSSNNAVNVDQ